MAFSPHQFFWGARNLHLFFSMGEKTWTSWWLNQPIWKICSSNWVHLPQINRGENKKIKPPQAYLRMIALIIRDAYQVIWNDLVIYIHWGLPLQHLWVTNLNEFQPTFQASIKKPSPLDSLSVTGLVDSCTHKKSLSLRFFLGRKPIGWKGTLMTHRVTAHVCEVESTVWLSYIINQYREKYVPNGE